MRCGCHKYNNLTAFGMVCALWEPTRKVSIGAGAFGSSWLSRGLGVGAELVVWLSEFIKATRQELQPKFTPTLCELNLVLPVPSLPGGISLAFSWEQEVDPGPGAAVACGQSRSLEQPWFCVCSSRLFLWELLHFCHSEPWQGWEKRGGKLVWGMEERKLQIK